MDKDSLLEKINTLAKSHAIFKYGEIKDNYGLSLLLAESRIMQEELNLKIKFSNEAVLGVAIFSFVITIISLLKNELPIENTDYIFFLLVISILGCLGGIIKLSVYSKKNRTKMLDLKRLEEYLIVYLK